MPVDTSMYPQAQPPINLLDLVGKIQATQGVINQNRLFPGQQQLQQQQIRQSDLANQTSQQALRQSQVQAGNTYLSSVLSTSKNPTPADAYRAIANGAKAGLIPDDLAATLVSQVPSDPNEFKSWAGAVTAQGLSPESRGNLQFGTPTLISTGQGQLPVTSSPTQGLRQIGPTIPNAISPSELASPVQVFNPKTNALETITKAQLLQRTGGGGLPQTMTGQLDVSGQPASGLGSGRNTPASQGVQAGPSLGAAEAASAKAANSVKLGTALIEDSKNSPEMKGAYANMAAALKGFTPGPQADWTKVVKSFSNYFTPDVMQKLGVNFDPSKIANQEEFNKIANTIALQQGAQSDMHLNIAGGANPNSQMSKLGIQNVLGILQGNEDAKMIKAAAWQDYAREHGDQSFGEFSADFNKKFDPRVLQFEYLPADGRAKVLAEMKPAEKASFASKLRYAQQQGWIH